MAGGGVPKLHFGSRVYREQKRHMKLCPVTLLTSLPGRVPGQNYLCSLGSEDST